MNEKEYQEKIENLYDFLEEEIDHTNSQMKAIGDRKHYHESHGRQISSLGNRLQAIDDARLTLEKMFPELFKEEK